MKSLLPLIALTCFIGLSCSKKSDTPQTATPTAVDTLKYNVNNLSDVTIKQFKDSSMLLPVNLEYQSGIQEQITINFSGLPTGVTVSPASINGTPTFTGIFTLAYSSISTTGTYPMTVTTTGAVSGTKTFTMNLIVQASPCADAFVGAYTDDNTCTEDTISAPPTRNVTKGADDQHLVFGTEFGSQTAIVNCISGTITFPEFDTYFPYEITGTGTISGTTITINWKKKFIFDPFTETTCQSVYTKK